MSQEEEWQSKDNKNREDDKSKEDALVKVMIV